MNSFKKLGLVGLITIGVIISIAYGCGNTGKGNNSVKGEITIIQDESLPLNLSIFVDLSDRIEKSKDNMKQADKDQLIVNGLAERFVNKQKKEGFQKSEDKFQVVFYPAPAGAQTLAESLTLDLKSIKGPKKKDLLNFQKNHAENIKKLYDSALDAQDYFGSDIWGYFAKDKVKDLCKTGYRNVLVIFSDGYLYDANNKVQDGNNYSYILPKTLAIQGSGLIPCQISNSDMEVYFIECNANPQTDYPKMKAILEKWFTEMGLTKIDIQDTDLPAVVLQHLDNEIFMN
ncbi:MAG: hypothetical protein K2M19_04970 [Muribaculaceae bacterium]|nr:hypothetical protein [Muribaculaceae bacterium]